MKRRLLYTLALVPLFIVFIFSGIVGAILPQLSTPKVSAAIPDEYMFYTPSDGAYLSGLKKAINDRDEGASAFQNSIVYVKGSAFGKPFALRFNKDRSSCAQADHGSLSGCGGGVIGNRHNHFGGQDDSLYVYSGSYTCEQGKGMVDSPGDGGYYTIDFSVSLNMGKKGEPHTLFNGNDIKNTVRLHWMGLGTKNTAVRYTPPEQSGSARDSKDASIREVPDTCLPPGLPNAVRTSKSNDTEEDDDGIVNKQVPVWAKASKDLKAAWGNLENTSGEGAGTTEDPHLDCDRKWENPLTWIICPVVDILAGMIETIDKMITAQLEVKEDEIFCKSSNCSAYYSAWQQFRNIALGLMAIVGLIILIAHALGFEILDAYTIRKALPRLLIAAVAITLSWPLMQFAVMISNDLGYGVQNIIYAPFDRVSTDINLDTGNTVLNVVFGVFGVAGGAIAAVQLAGGIGALLAYAGTAALAVFVAIAVLILRQVAIIMMAILAPIAIIAYVLPNTQRIYRFWWEAFTRALLMFPLIAGFIAIGRVFAAISLQNPGSAGPLSQVIGFMAYFAPYFLIPLTFRMSGSIMSTLGNFVNERSQGGFNALKQARANLRKQNRAELAAGNALKGTNIPIYGQFARRYNDATRGIANVRNAGYNPRRWRERMRSAAATRSGSAMDEAFQNNPHLKAFMTDDDIVETGLQFQRDGDVYRELRRRGLTHERAEQGTAAIRAFRRSVDAKTFDKAMLVASAGTSSGWTPRKDADGNQISGGAGELRALVNEKMGNDRQGAIDVLGKVRQQAESKGRFDLVGGSFTDDAKMLEEYFSDGVDGRKIDTHEWTQRIHRNALDGQSRQRLLNGHQRSLEAMAPEMGVQLEEQIRGLATGGVERDAASGTIRIKAGAAADPDWTPTHAVEQYAFMADSLDSASYAAPEMARHIKKQLDGRFDWEGADPTLRARLTRLGVEGPEVLTRNSAGAVTARRPTTHADIMEALRNDPEFARYRREYGAGRQFMDAEQRELLERQARERGQG